MADGAALGALTLAAQAEMALVRADPVAAALLAQAARAGEGRPEGAFLRAAADLARAVDLTAGGPPRKVAQALCRAGALLAGAAALGAEIKETQ